MEMFLAWVVGIILGSYLTWMWCDSREDIRWWQEHKDKL